jgi:hypothetical protein
VHCTSHGIYSTNVLRLCVHAASVGKNVLKRGSYGAKPDHSRTAGMNADDIVFLSPACHQTFNVRLSQSFVKASLYLIGGSGVVMATSFGHRALRYFKEYILPWAVEKKPPRGGLFLLAI